MAFFSSAQQSVCSRFYGGRAAYPGMNGHRDEEGLGAFRHWNQCPPGLLDHGGLYMGDRLSRGAQNTD